MNFTTNNLVSPMKTMLRRFASVSGLTLLLSFALLAQVSDRILSVNAGEASEGKPVELRVDLANAVSVSQMFLNYRSAGGTDYKRIEMAITGNSVTATIPGEDVVPNEIEYYFVLTVLMKDGYETYPTTDPKNNPLRLTVHPAPPKEQILTFLSPDTGRAISSDELIIAFSLKNVSPLIDLSAMKMFIDGNDVTKSAAVADSLVTLDPQKLPSAIGDGDHTFRVDLFSNKGQLYYSQTLKFTQGPLFAMEGEHSQFLYNVSAQLESRQERFVDVWTPYNRGLLTLSTQRGSLTLDGRVYVTNEERTDRQHVDQFSVEAKAPWFRVAYGDDYPTFPSLIMSGKKIRGLSGYLHLGFFNVDYVNGDVSRSIEGDTLRTRVGPPDTTGTYAPYDTADGKNIWAQYQYGTYRRKLTVIRPSFGSGESFQLGFSYLKSQDDTNSIRYGINPQENLVLGSDLFIGALNRKLQITAQGAASAYNSKIAGGTLTDQQIQSLYSGQSDSANKADDLKKIRDLVSKFITVNENIVPLSSKKLSAISAYEGAISLDEFDNYIKGTYMFHGSSFHSFGQTYTRNDVKGFNIYDRLRLMTNQLFLTGTYELLDNNTDGAQYATTEMTNWNGSAAYYPRFRFPNVTVGYGQTKNSNGLSDLDIHGPDSMKAFTAREDLTNRVYVQLGYDFMQFARNTASLNVSTSNTDDQTYNNFDTKTTVVTAMLVSTWNFPLQSTLGLSVNDSKYPTAAGQTSLNYTTLTLGGRYRLLEERLRLFASIIPSFGDVKRSVWTAGADYSLLTNLVVSFNGTLIDNSTGYTDSMLSLMLRYNM